LQSLQPLPTPTAPSERAAKPYYITTLLLLLLLPLLLWIQPWWVVGCCQPLEQCSSLRHGQAQGTPHVANGASIRGVKHLLQ
jgi:hypothetical protein